MRNECKNASTVWLVTGASGHLGNNVVRALKDMGQHVRAFIIEQDIPPALEDLDIEYVRGDITDRDAVDPLFADTEGLDVIVLHLAGYVTIYGKTDERAYNINVIGTNNMLEAAKAHRVKRFLYTSTVHAIPEPDTDRTIFEIDHFDPDTVHGYYAKTKALATQNVMDAIKDGLDAVVVHPSGIIGPYDYLNSHTTRLFRRLVDKKLPGMVSGGYDFVDVRDVADGIIKAALKGKSGETYILSGSYYSICDIVNMAAEMTGRKQFKIKVPRFLAKIAAPFVEWSSKVTGTPPIFTSYSISTLNSRGKFSNEKARKMLGYTTRPIRETVRDTLEFMKRSEQFSTSFVFQNGSAKTQTVTR
ncbi:MAG TPA: NAD-dependent epimerase/dehydratase family protein [Clostridiaceae bacterium]|nr:NAD-dependent epimerase/dehydratase family protein [Clostridiaceae bacterium]